MAAAEQLVPVGFSLAAALCWGTSDFSGGYASRRSDSFLVTALSHAGGFIFTTSLPPALTAGAPASIRWLKEHNEVRIAHQERAAALKARMAAAGLPVMPSVSPIVPVLVGDPEHRTLV